MPFDGAFGDHKHIGDLAVGFAFRDQERNFALAAGQIAGLVESLSSRG